MGILQFTTNYRFYQLENVQLDITCQIEFRLKRNMFSLQLFLLQNRLVYHRQKIILKIAICVWQKAQPCKVKLHIHCHYPESAVQPETLGQHASSRPNSHK